MSRTLAEAILNNGYVEIEINPNFLRPRLKAIQAGLERITDSPKLAALFPWRVLEQDAYGQKYAQEVGLVLRTDDEHKWIFHYTPDAKFERMPEVRRDPHLCDFFDAHRDLDEKARKHAFMLATSLDEKNREINAYKGSLVHRISRGRIISRDLRYLRAHPGKSDAFPHLDRSLLTNHWGATQTGLMVRTPGANGQWKRVDERSCSSVGMFPGRKFGAVSRGSLGFGTLHGVKYDRLEDVDRYSFISFIHPASNAGDATFLMEHDDELKAHERSFAL